MSLKKVAIVGAGVTGLTTAIIAENYICTDDSSPNVIRHITIDLSGSGLEGIFRSGLFTGIAC